ncbi:MAG: endolytic transglycosylase MltG [Spirochaetia bacterium]|nr:endolytic transglycosylase MltG [Spirochaetia bacterium]
MKNNFLKPLNVVIAIVFIFFLSVYVFYSSSGSSQEVSIEIPSGAGFNTVAKVLKEKGAIGDSRLFKLYALSRGDLNNIKPGEYLFKEGTSKKAILDAITKGDVLLYKITIPEGTNIYQIADILSQELKVDKQEFLKKAKDHDLMKQWQIEGDSVEGYLYPETYYFARGSKSQQILDKMLITFNEEYDKNKVEIETKGKKLGLTRHQIITFASIIEKETGLAGERELISAVFHNRIKRGMKFQSDPTTIYGIFERYHGNLTKKDLLENTPYNTYRIKGLPPGPIASPGMESIKAVVNPSDVNYLYFVAKHDKSHVFSNNLVEHNANVNKYQIQR